VGGLRGCALEKRGRGKEGGEEGGGEEGEGERPAQIPSTIHEPENTTDQKPPLSDLSTTAKEKQDSLPPPTHSYH